MTTPTLTGQRFLVVGGSSGIGLAVAGAAKAAGAAVTVASRSREKLDAALGTLGDGAVAAVLDTGDAGAIERFFADQAPWDHIVVSAAETARGPVRELDPEAAKAAMESKFWGAYRVARSMRIGQRGTLTLISGFLSARPQAAAPLQGAINAALEALARGLALELAPVRVNSVSPGLIDTSLHAGMRAEDRQAMFDGAAARLPARRVGQPKDIADAILFVATNGFTTGSTITVDGGATIAN